MFITFPRRMRYRVSVCEPMTLWNRSVTGAQTSETPPPFRAVGHRDGGHTIARWQPGASTNRSSIDRAFLGNIGMETTSPLAANIPEILFVAYQMTFAIITVALVAGSVADRMRFSAFVWFAILWLPIVYVPIAHWVWGNGWLMKLGMLDFAGGTVVHLNAGVAGLVAACMLGRRAGYGSENLAPYDLSLAVIGTGLL
jgi:Amt family ammonium transporter